MFVMSLPKVKAKDPKLNKTIHCISNELLTSPLPVYKKGLDWWKKGSHKERCCFWQSLVPSNKHTMYSEMYPKQSENGCASVYTTLGWVRERES